MSAPLGKAGPLRAGDLSLIRGYNLGSADDVNRTEIPERKVDADGISQQVIQCPWNILFVCC